MPSSPGSLCGHNNPKEELQGARAGTAGLTLPHPTGQEEQVEEAEEEEESKETPAEGEWGWARGDWGVPGWL